MGAVLARGAPHKRMDAHALAGACGQDNQAAAVHDHYPAETGWPKPILIHLQKHLVAAEQEHHS